ncbi:MAG: hypothetical protein ACJAWS_000442 [Oleiphilaceae bacterium]|jgi:hypothetical protein
MKRLYYLSPSVESVEHVSNDLHEKGITDWNFHIISKDETGLYSHHLSSASLIHRTDVVRFVERGLIAGGFLSVLFAMPLTYVEGFTFSVWVVVSLFCILFGSWAGFIGGISQENYKISRFHDYISAGQYLIMVDVAKKHEKLIRCVMEVRHPEAIAQGKSSVFTNPFASEDFQLQRIEP